MKASGHQKVQVSLLEMLGIPREQISDIRDTINGRRAEGDVVELRTLLSAAQSVQERYESAPDSASRLVPLPVDRLDRLVRKVPGETLKIPFVDDFPVPQISADGARIHEDGLAKAVPAEVFGDRIPAVTSYLTKVDKDLADRLAVGEATVGELSARLGTEEAWGRFGAGLEKLMGALAKHGGPAHEARDLNVDLSSRFTHLDGAATPGEIGCFQQRGLQWFTAKRDKTAGQFTVHGFERDALVVTVPKGATVLLLNSQGNHTGARLRPTSKTIEGETHSAVTVERGMVQRPDEYYHTDPNFGVRVIDKSGEVLYERNFAFDKQESATSKRIFSGQLASNPTENGEHAELWDHYVPDRSNATPVGERPRFELQGEVGDRIRLEKDGKTYDLHRLSQFLEPPRSIDQRFKAEGGPVVLRYANTNAKTLDDPGYSPTASGKLRQGSRNFTFDRKLAQTQQAHWGARGLRVFADGMHKVKGLFDPLQ